MQNMSLQNNDLATKSPYSENTKISRSWLISAIEVLFLTLPKAKRPGVWSFFAGALALLITFSRTTIYGYLFNFLWVLTLGMKADLPDRVLTWLTFVFFEELSRFAFIRVATNKVLAGVIFFAFTVVIETISYYRPTAAIGTYLMLRLPTILIHIVATSAFVWASTRPKAKWPVFFLVWLPHAAFDVWTSYITL